MPQTESAEAMPPSSLAKTILFGPHNVTTQVFHRTRLSFALVNIRPLLPGHILVCPHRPVAHLSELSGPEVTDLYTTVQRIQRTLRRVYGAEAFNVAMQDGRAAGQTVAHVHCHVIPRRMGDMDAQGGGDRIYEMLDGEEGDVGAGLRGERRRRHKTDAERRDRSEEEMVVETEMLRREMQRDAETEQS